MQTALDGIRVIDLTQVMAGPFCTMQLGDMGADVIKVEPPGGDLSRRLGSEEMQSGGDAAPFFSLNRNKRSVVLDLAVPAGRSAFLALARTADVVVESFRPGVVRRLGVDHQVVSRLNPRVIYASISGFGQSGPYAGRPGFDLVAQGMSGIMSVTGEPGGPPVKTGIPISDLAAGLFAASAIMAALYAREKTGEGQYLETSLFEAAVALSPWESTELWATGRIPQPLGSAHRLSAPYQVFRTASGYITIAALNEKQWMALCSALGRPELSSNERFATNARRLSNRAQLVTEIEDALAGRGASEWVDALLAAGVPAGPVLDYSQVFADSHTEAIGMIAPLDHPVAGRINTIRHPVRFGSTPTSVRRPPPLLGEHSDEILHEIEAGGTGR
ncbi:MAG: CaiB/BaiF CoA transferase family protein [Gemmatimonadota bacterium]